MRMQQQYRKIVRIIARIKHRRKYISTNISMVIIISKLIATIIIIYKMINTTIIHKIISQLKIIIKIKP
jgi:hypothetical protein